MKKDKPKHKHKFKVSMNGWENPVQNYGTFTYIPQPLNYAIAICEECGMMIKQYI